MNLLQEIKRLHRFLIDAEWYALEMQACVP